MRTLHRSPQNFTVTPQHKAMRFGGSLRISSACLQPGCKGSAKAACASSKIGTSPDSSSSSSSSNKIVVLDAVDRQTVVKTFRASKTASEVLSVLAMVAGAGLLEASDGDVLLGADNLPAGEYFYQRAPTPGGLGVSTRSYQDITVDIAGDTIESQEVFKIDIASRAGLQSMLESRDVYFLLDPVSRGLVSFDCVDLHDNMLLSAVRGCVQLKDRVSNLEAFDVSVAKDFKQAATEAIRQGLLKQHSSVKVIDVQELTCADGSTQKVDGVVIAGGCAAILVAEQQLDDSAVPQLWSCLEFIRDKELTGPAAELKGKMLLGYLAGKTVTSDPGAIKALVRNCHLQGYRILLGSGKSLVPDNRRETTTRVDP